MNNILEFWEENFLEKGEMWGFEPSKSSILIKKFFLEKGIKNILIHGVGYGRNAKTFIESGISVTGIEISQTAINIAKKYFGENLKIFYGSINNMPFDNRKYEGIFSYSLIHLLDEEERKKFIENCYESLEKDGYMIFVTISKKSKTFGKGKFISENRFETFPGVKIFFYDEENIKKEFGNYLSLEISEIEENYPFYILKVQKK